MPDLAGQLLARLDLNASKAQGALATTTLRSLGGNGNDQEEDEEAVLKLVMPATAAELEERNAAPGRLLGVRR